MDQDLGVVLDLVDELGQLAVDGELGPARRLVVDHVGYGVVAQPARCDGCGRSALASRPDPGAARTSRGPMGSPHDPQTSTASAVDPHALWVTSRGGQEGAAYLSPHWRMVVSTGQRSRPLSVRR